MTSHEGDLIRFFILVDAHGGPSWFTKLFQPNLNVLHEQRCAWTRNVHNPTVGDRPKVGRICLLVLRKQEFHFSHKQYCLRIRHIHNRRR
jgi:hypothetical protein